MSGNFDRIATPSRQPRPGRQALFSAPRRRWPAVACERCGAATALGWTVALRMARPPVWCAPWRRHFLRASCPACRRRAWLGLTNTPSRQ